jgi:hypothetical protein
MFFFFFSFSPPGSAWLEATNCPQALWFRNTKLFPAVLKEVCALVGIVLTRDAKMAAMELDFWLLDEPFDVVDFVTIEARIKQVRFWNEFYYYFILFLDTFVLLFGF